MTTELMRHRFEVAVESSQSGYDISFSGVHGLVHGLELSF